MNVRGCLKDLDINERTVLEQFLKEKNEGEYELD
jgi:hypothetical protein